MVTATTHNIKISVETFYQQDYSCPASHHFLFAYRITIENHSSAAVQLLRRHWSIIDGLGQRREVEGEGVVGVQPVIKSGEKYEYISGCDFKTDTGKMFGTFLMENRLNETTFRVVIPEFYMVAPQKLN